MTKVASNPKVASQLATQITKPEALRILRLLSALESWSFAEKHRLPDYLLEDLQGCGELLEREILGPTDGPTQKGSMA